jgi:hypothetical protein
MANTNFATDGSIGANFDRRTVDAEHELGTVVIGNDDTIWLYVQASQTVGTGTCTVNTSTWALTDIAGNHTADVAFATDEYGWVRQTVKLSA